VSEIYSLDIETTGLDRFKDRILTIGVYSPGHRECFDSVDAFTSWYRSCLYSPLFVMHRGSFDVNFLRHHGIDLRSSWGFDTRSIASIAIPGPGLAEGQKRELSLENLAIQLLGEESYKLNRENMGSYTSEEVKAYCLKDCEITYRIFEKFVQEMSESSWKFVESWLMPATKFCADLEYEGIKIDIEGLSRYRTVVEQKKSVVLEELEEITKQAIQFYHEKQVREVSDKYKEMYEKAKIKAKDKAKCFNRYQKLEELAICRLESFNWNSSEQLKWLLKEYYQLDIYNNREEKETTNEAMLKSLDHPVAKKLVDYREFEKLCSTCIPALLENIAPTGNVHSNYNIGGTRTGRLSSSGPNLQQIPKGPIRSYICAAPSRNLLTIDYAQIEVRILAELAKEEKLITAFKEGIDAYSVIAKDLLKIDCPVKDIKQKFKKERDVSKTAGLSILYGTGAAKLQEVLQKELGEQYSLRECKQFIEEYRNGFPGIKALRKRLDRELANGKVCYNLLGRPFYIESNDDIYMKGLNTLVQGSASDLVLWSQTNFVIPALKELGVDFKHRMVIHDEIVLELAENEAELLTREVIIPAMTTQIEQALNLTVPLTVEYNISREWNKP
jgi:DNA polymerase I-like protein with 3'-5' exonuclease and polymerase domains